ncbi:MAG: sulfurtransferase TusA family protein [Candidatus Poribacteria bacterium]|nr:sulfurtransferase TusA family protein [Candidatus Poribacteria bacterium]
MAIEYAGAYDASAIPTDVAREIEIYEIQLDRFQAGQVEEATFTEFRLRRGVYGQRDDRSQMIRVKIPFGGLTAAQLEMLADVAEEFSDNIIHITTRQDVQYHYVDINTTSELMRRLASVDITTKEACGNVVRNVTACPLSGVCHDETFDVTPYSKALSAFLLGHPDAENFGRKFKIAFSGCEEHACGLANMHDIGAVAAVKEVDGEVKRGFKLYVGGGLGAVPHQAKVFDDFLPAEELLPISQSICRVFTRLGERRNRNKARLKFVIAKHGIEEFRKLVLEDRETLRHDPEWTAYLDNLDAYDESPLKPPTQLNGTTKPEGFEEWHQSNVQLQSQPGYAFVTITLPLGDITADQTRALADISRKYVKDTIRATVEQNIVLRWVTMTDLPALYRELKEIGLGDPGAESMVDITACPGTDSCKLGVSSSRGLAAHLRSHFIEAGVQNEIKDFRIKISGCPNSCGQHHIANIGFFGSSKRVGGHIAPVYLVLLGGHMIENASSYGLATGKIHANYIPAFIEELTGKYVEEKQDDETFTDYVGRLGKVEIKSILSQYDQIPPYEEAPEFYIDTGDTKDYQLKTGVGECAGEVIALVSMKLEEADRLIYESGLNLEKGKYQDSAELAFDAMIRATDGLLTTVGLQYIDDATTVNEFRTHFFDPGNFFAGFGAHLFKATEEDSSTFDHELAHRRVEEATLFVEESHNVYNRMRIKQEEEEASKRKTRRSRPAPKPKVVKEKKPVEEITDSLDLKGVACPFNYVQAKVRLETMQVGQLLEITIDDGEPIENVPKSLTNDGHDILDTKKIGKHYRLTIKKGE